MQGIDGHEESHIYSRLGEDPAYLIVSRWQSEDAFKDFVASDAFKKVTNWGKQNILSATPQPHDLPRGLSSRAASRERVRLRSRGCAKPRPPDAVGR